MDDQARAEALVAEWIDDGMTSGDSVSELARRIADYGQERRREALEEVAVQVCSHIASAVRAQAAQPDYVFRPTGVEDNMEGFAVSNMTRAEQQAIHDAVYSVHGRPAAIYLEISAERFAQDRQWGGPQHDDQHAASDWILFTREQLNQAEHSDDYRHQMIQVAALAVAAIESWDRAVEAMQMNEPLISGHAADCKCELCGKAWAEANYEHERTCNCDECKKRWQQANSPPATNPTVEAALLAAAIKNALVRIDGEIARLEPETSDTRQYVLDKRHLRITLEGIAAVLRGTP